MTEVQYTSACQDRQVGESAAKSLSREHNRITPVSFEL